MKQYAGSEFHPGNVNCGRLKDDTEQIGNMNLKILLFTVMLVMASAAVGQVDLEPHDPVYYERDNAVFTCSAQNAQSVQWHYNETLQPFISTDFSELLGVGVLRINHISKLFNQTMLQCEAVYSNGRALSGRSSILIQGITSSAFNLRFEFSLHGRVHIFWRAPFSLDVSDSEVDVTFCVDILNSSSRVLMYSKCGINQTDHTCESFPDLVACSQYFISVKAENRVGNSTAVNITASNGEFHVVNFTRLNFTAISTQFEILLNQSFCSILTVLKANDAKIEYNMKTRRLIEFDLENNKHYKNIALEISIPDKNSKNLNLGSLKTYDVVDLFTSLNGSNAIILRSSFVQHSIAIGVLYILMYIDNGSVDFPKSVYLPVSKADAEDGLKIEKISSGSFLIMAYDIEHDGHLQHYGYPSTTQWIHINGSDSFDENRSAIQLCSLTATGLRIEIICLCNENQNFQALLQWNDGSIESIQNITSKKQICLKSIVFHVTRPGAYFAIMFHDAKGRGILSSNVIGTLEFLVNESSAVGSDDIVTDIHSRILTTISTHANVVIISRLIEVAVPLCVVVMIIGTIFTLVTTIYFTKCKKRNKKSSTGGSKDLLTERISSEQYICN